MTTTVGLLFVWLLALLPSATAFAPPSPPHGGTMPFSSHVNIRKHQPKINSDIFLAMSSTPILQEQAIVLSQPTLRRGSNNALDAESSKTIPMIQRATTLVPRPVNVLNEMILGSTTTLNAEYAEYQRGLITIGFITLLFASNSPVLHAAFHQGSNPSPPVVLVNAAVSIIALVGLLLGGEKLESNTPLPHIVQDQIEKQQLQQVQATITTNMQQLPLWLQGGLELGFWKFLGTTANLYGLSMTSASHGAFFIQLTTLMVPVVQGLMGVAIPQRIQWSVVLALAGVVSFALDPMTATGTGAAAAGASSVVDVMVSSSSSVLWGDALCVMAAAFYATYDLRLFAWGKRVAPRQLITTKIATQAFLSLVLVLVLVASNCDQGIQVGEWWNQIVMQHTTTTTTTTTAMMLTTVVPCVLWSGVAVNAVAPFLQVGGQQVVGPTRCQTIYASQPLWAALLSYAFLGETVGLQGMLGATAFLSALFLAATAKAPDPN